MLSSLLLCDFRLVTGDLALFFCESFRPYSGCNSQMSFSELIPRTMCTCSHLQVIAKFLQSIGENDIAASQAFLRSCFGYENLLLLKPGQKAAIYYSKLHLQYSRMQAFCYVLDITLIFPKNLNMCAGCNCRSKQGKSEDRGIM